MTSFTSSYKGLVSLTRAFIFIMGVMIVMNSCDLFFRKELRQDLKLAYYRHEAYKISDSIKTNQDKIKAYKLLLKNIGEDEQLITPRKKNILLSELYSILSTEYFDAYMINEAIESCSVSIMLDINSPHAYYNRACLYQYIGDDSLAIVDYTKTISNNEYYTDAYYNRGIIYDKQENYDLAIKDLSETIRLNPAYLADAYNNRGNIYQKVELFDKALSDYNSAIKLDTTNMIVYSNRADLYRQQGSLAEALSDYEKVLEVDSTNLMILDKIKEIKEDVKKLQFVENEKKGLNKQKRK